jgi:hypothetical protein
VNALPIYFFAHENGSFTQPDVCGETSLPKGASNNACVVLFPVIEENSLETDTSGYTRDACGVE